MEKQVETSIMVLGAVWGGGAGFRLEGLGFCAMRGFHQICQKVTQTSRYLFLPNLSTSTGNPATSPAAEASTSLR